VFESHDGVAMTPLDIRSSGDADGWRFVNSPWLYPVRALSIVPRVKFRDALEAL
jgi:hypothetical protein